MSNCECRTCPGSLRGDFEVDSNPQPSSCKAPNIPLNHRAPVYCVVLCVVLYSTFIMRPSHPHVAMKVYLFAPSHSLNDAMQQTQSRLGHLEITIPEYLSPFWNREGVNLMIFPVRLYIAVISYLV